MFRYTCNDCKREIEGEPSAGMNMPGVTDGPTYWCFDCAPPPSSAEEVIRMIDSFICPPKEPGNRDRPGP